MCLTTLYLHQDGLNALNSFHLSFYLIFQQFPKSGDPHKINMFKEKYLVNNNIKKCLKKKTTTLLFLYYFRGLQGQLDKSKLETALKKRIHQSCWWICLNELKHF